MGLVQTSDPAAFPIHIAEIRAHLRFEGMGTEEDALLMGYARSAVDYVEEELGRPLIERSYELTLERFPCRFGEPIRIPPAPLQAVTSVVYLDALGMEQTLPTADYVAFGIGDQGGIALAQGKSWPSTRCHPEAVTINFTAGFGPDHNHVPEAIRHALLMLVAHWSGCREASASDVPVAVPEVLSAWRVRLL
jgi:uncharacterized phiE125 gp8 family phage protein